MSTMPRLKISKPLTDRAQEALANYFRIWWSALELAPGYNRDVRGIFVMLGLIRPKGKPALTPLGTEVIKFITADDRPKYPHKKTKVRAR